MIYDILNTAHPQICCMFMSTKIMVKNQDSAKSQGGDSKSEDTLYTVGVGYSIICGILDFTK